MSTEEKTRALREAVLRDLPTLDAAVKSLRELPPLLRLAADLGPPGAESDAMRRYAALLDERLVVCREAHRRLASYALEGMVLKEDH